MLKIDPHYLSHSRFPCAPLVKRSTTRSGRKTTAHGSVTSSKHRMSAFSTTKGRGYSHSRSYNRTRRNSSL